MEELERLWSLGDWEGLTPVTCQSAIHHLCKIVNLTLSREQLVADGIRQSFVLLNLICFISLLRRLTAVTAWNITTSNERTPFGSGLETAATYWFYCDLEFTSIHNIIDDLMKLQLHRTKSVVWLIRFLVNLEEKTQTLSDLEDL